MGFPNRSAGKDMKKILALTAPLAIIATTAFATDSVVKRLEPYGEISLLSFHGDGWGASEDIWLGDFGVRLPSLATSGALKYSFYVGYDGGGSIGGDSSIWSGYGTAAMVLENGPHAISFGVPRTVIHDVFRDGDVISSKLLRNQLLNLSDITRLVRMETALADTGMSSIYGLRYNGDFGKTTFSAAVFSGNAYDENMHSVQLALTHEMDRVSLRAGFERSHVDAFRSAPERDDGTISTYSLGATAKFDKLSVGLDMTVTGFSTSNLKTAQMFGTYKINERLRVGASYLVVDAGDNSNQYPGLGVEYVAASGAYARLSGMFGSETGQDTNIFELAAGVRF